MNIVYDLVDPQELVDYVRGFANEVLYNQFTLERFLPNRLVDDLEFRIRTGSWTDVETAEYRAWDTDVPLTNRQGISRLRGELPPLGRQIPLTEEEFLRRRALEGGDYSAIVDQIFADAERMTRSVQARIEYARGEALTTGTVTIEENGLQLTADYDMDPTHQPTAAIDWDDTDALILDDLLAWIELYVDDNGVPPAGLLMSRTVWGYMYRNEQLRDAAGFAGTVPSRLNNDAIDAVLASNGIPPIEIYDTRVRVNRVSTRVIPADKVVFVPPASEPLGHTFYGTTAEALKLASKGLIKASATPGIVAVVLENDSPVQTFTKAAAIALPVIPNPSLLLCADVLGNGS